MTQLEFYQAKLAYEIDAADVKAALEAGEKLILIDTRATAAFERESIPGALSLPHRTMNAEPPPHCRAMPCWCRSAMALVAMAPPMVPSSCCSWVSGERVARRAGLVEA
jgi:hypothetical protein